MLVTLAGIVMSVNLIPIRAPFPMVVTLLRLNEVTPALANIYPDNVFTLSPMVMLVRAGLFPNRPSVGSSGPGKV